MRSRALCWLLFSPTALAVGEDPAQIIAGLETRLLAAQRVVVEVEIRSQGAYSAQLRGSTELLPRNHLNLAYSGTFGGQPAELSLRADSRALDLYKGPDQRREGVGAESNRAVIIGFLRMGLLHNLARLTALQGPDHASGGVEQWVSLDSYRPTTFAQDGDLEGTYSFGFDILVDGEAAGSARLWLDPVSGLPRRRVQTVRFAQGELTVVEDYHQFVVE